MTEEMGKVSAMNRLKKAASLGFGPLMERKQAADESSRRSSDDRREYRSRSRSRGRGGGSAGASGSGGGDNINPNNPAALAVREQQERRREALRQVLKGPSDEPDLDGFLNFTKKVAPAAPKLDVKVSKMDLKISTNATMRVTAAGAGARPKAGAKAGPAVTREAAALLQRQQEEKTRAEFEQMQRDAKKSVGITEKASARKGEFEADEDFDSDEEDRKKDKREQKKNREDWRKKRREELKKGGAKEKGDSESGPEDSDEDEVKKKERLEKEESKARAQAWRSMNNNGRYSKVAGQYVGQLSDRDLDKRISDAAAKSKGESLMSEAEVLAKINKGRTGRERGDRGRSGSPLRKYNPNDRLGSHP